jgi:hypothetical protein
MQVIVHPAEKLLALLKLYRCTHTSLDMHKKIRKRKKKVRDKGVVQDAGIRATTLSNTIKIATATDSNKTAIQKENFENKGFPFMTLSI